LGRDAHGLVFLKTHGRLVQGDFYCPYLLLLNARRIQALLQQQDFLIAFDASELLPRVLWPSSAAADFLRANALRFAPPAGPWTGTIRFGFQPTNEMSLNLTNGATSS
jgi:hypothetical protein